MIRLLGAAYHLPSTRATIDDWCRELGRPAETAAALQASGARHYHHAAGEGLVELAVHAGEKLLASQRLRRDEINALVWFNTSQVNVLAPPASTVGQVRAALRLPQALAFGISQQNCVSGFHGLRVLSALFAAHPEWRAAMVIGADTILWESLRAINTDGFHSDAASALLVSPDRPGPAATPRIIALDTYNDARLVRGVLPDGSFEANPHYLWSAISLIRRTLQQAGITPEQVVSVLPHNANLPAWQHIMAASRIPFERLYTANIASRGHAFGSDCAINLADSGALRTPGHHLVFGSGIAGCFGAFVLEVPAGATLASAHCH